MEHCFVALDVYKCSSERLLFSQNIMIELEH